MCTIFEKLGTRFSLLKTVLLAAFVICTILFVPKDVIAQENPVSVNITVMPPYTSSLYDYINVPNKIVITLTHTNISYPEVQLYLKASIVSEKGISVTTEQGYKPSEPIVLSPGKMYRLTNENISEAFSLKHTIIEGAELSELLSGAGLPEDYYQICVQAFDYNTDQPLSGDQPIGCSSLFNVTNLDPPQITFPLCGDEIEQTPQQMININWTPPSGALPGTKYNFEMVEIPANSTIDPIEAFEAATYPLFFEETTGITQMPLTVQKALLSPGYTYAFRIRAIDPNERLHFRNDGYSEVCYFKYKEKEKLAVSAEKSIRFAMPAYNSIDSVLTVTPSGGLQISWRVEPFDTLKYHDPLDDFPGCHFNVEFFDSENGKQPVYTSTTENPYLQIDNSDNTFVNRNPYWVQVSIENKGSKEKMLVSEKNGFRFSVKRELQNGYSQRTLSGILKYQFENEGTDSYPASNLNLNLKCIYLLTDKNSGKQYEIPEDDVVNVMTGGLNSSRSSNELFLNDTKETALNVAKEITESKGFNLYPSELTQEAVATTVTSANGSFSFNYAWPNSAPLGEVNSSFTYTSSSTGTVTGSLERAMRIEITNPYYSSPQTVIMNNFATFDLGEITAYVYSYQLNAYISKGYSKNSGIEETLVGKKIYILRKQKMPGIPLYEGERLGQFSLTETPKGLKSAGYYIVASDETVASKNDKGEAVAVATFHRLIANRMTGDEYYWYAEGMGLQSALPFSFKQSTVPKSKGLGQSSPIQTTIPDKTEDINLSNSAAILASSLNATITTAGRYSFNVDVPWTIISDEPPMSGISGRLVYEFKGKPGDTRPLANRKISIISCLVTDEPGQVSKIVLFKNANWNDNSYPQLEVLSSSGVTDANGNFNFQFPNIRNEGTDPTSGDYYISTGNMFHFESDFLTQKTKEESTSPHIVYEQKHVKVKRVLRLVVEDPLGVFMSPDDNIEIKPLETVNVGTLTSTVMSYSVEGSASYIRGYNETEIVQNADCYLLRKKSDIEEFQLPTDEGQNIAGSINELPDYKIICKATTDNSEGEFVFNNVVYPGGNSLVWYFKTKEMLGEAICEPFITTYERPDKKEHKTFLKPFYFFNADYVPFMDDGYVVILTPLTATIKGKVISNVDAGKGIDKAKCDIVFHMNNSSTINKTILTDNDGYFDFASIFEEIKTSDNIDKIKQIEVEISKSGFHYIDGNVSTKSYKITFNDQSDFKEGKQTVLNNIILYGNGNIKGRIVNEGQIPVDAYVQFLENSKLPSTSEGAMQETSKLEGSKGFFDIPAIPGTKRQLIVIPKNVSYFSDTITLTVNENGVTDLGNITVYERSHRIEFNVQSTEKAASGRGYRVIKNAKVELIGSPSPVVAYSNENGIVNMSFKNVSENNLSIRVSGPTGSNYVPQTISFTNYESDKVVRLPTVHLEQGITVRGKVLLDGKPTSEAEIYVELNSLDAELNEGKSSQGENVESESQSLFKAYPANDGSFEIKTIPPELNGKNIFLKAVYKKSSSSLSVKSIDLLANKDKATTVIGTQRMVKVPNTAEDVVLEMKTYDGMEINNLFGFPIEITYLTVVPDKDYVYVSGRVKLDGYCPGFDPMESLVFEVSNVRYKPMQFGTQKRIGVPDQNEVVINAKRDLKMKYGKAFNVKLTASGSGVLKLKGTTDGIGKGQLSANVAIVDNSFQYPSSYLDFDGTNFNLCEKISFSGRKPFINPDIVVFNASTNGDGNKIVKYNLCNLSSTGKAEDLKFKFINFDTKATASNSTIEGNIISLDATLMAKMKNAGDIEVNIGKLVLKNNTIDAISGKTPVMIKLKDGGIIDESKLWNIEVKDWSIDTREGGLTSSNCVLHTGSIDIPYSYFNLRSDFAYLGNPTTSDIKIGGYPVAISKGASVSTGYNPSCAGDKKGHWQVIFFPDQSGKTPATVSGLPNMGNVPLELETVSLYSNGDDVFTIGSGANKMWLYNTVEFKPQTVISLTDGLVLKGNAIYHIPRVQDKIGMRLLFSKSQPVNSNPTFDPIDLSFSGKGNIRFADNAKDQKFFPSEQTFTTFGTVEEKGVLRPINVEMIYHGNKDINQAWTEIFESPLAPNQTVKIGEENAHLEHVTCRTKADQTDWDLFVFEGDLTGTRGISTESNKHMKFTVHGEIKAEQNGFKAEGIKQSFDGMQITYQKGRLIGSLTMSNVPLGAATVSGVANILMDSYGWVFYSNCRASNVSAPDPCNLNMGILIGNYPKVNSEMENTVLQYAIKKEMPATFSSGLKGFYMVGGRELPISGLDAGIDLILIRAYARVPIAAVDASFYGNVYNGNLTLGTGLSGKLKIELGLGSVLCTDLYGSLEATIGVGAEADTKGNFNLKGDASFKSEIRVSQGVPYLLDCINGIEVGKTVSGGFSFSTTPFDAKFYIDL